MQTPDKFYGLDHLRTLAILMVFFFHYYIISGGKPEWLPEFASFGWTGVDLFFVLSGFLISFPLLQQVKQQKQVSIKSFFLKRSLKIIPAYVVTLCLYFCFPFFREKEALPPLWKFLTFTQNLGLNIKDNGTFSHCWSLCVEEHFYLFFPMAIWCLQSFKLYQKSYWILIVLFGAGFATRILSYQHLYIPQSEADFGWLYWYKYIYYPTYNRIDGLLSGICVADIYHFHHSLWLKLSKYGNVLFIISLLVLVIAFKICEDQQSFWASVAGFPLIALGFGIMVSSAISPTCFLYKWHSASTSFIAAISYSLYLTHKGIIHCTLTVINRLNINDNLVFIVSLMASILTACLLYWIIEKPFLTLKQKIVVAE